MTIARGAPTGLTVDLAIRDRDSSVGLVAGYNMHSADERNGDVIYPDIFASIQGDGIPTPNILWIELCYGNVLLMVSLSFKRVRTSAAHTWMMTFLTPPLRLSPFPLITPADPLPIRVLSLPTLIGELAALS